MKLDELRELADALEPMARAPRFEDFDVQGFCAWVRACADAEPVAWVYEHDGHHTEAVGLDQSIKDAQAAVCELKRELAMGKREPLSDDEILDIATAAGLRFSMYSDDVETRAAIKQLARAIEREHGIGGSDE